MSNTFRFALLILTVWLLAIPGWFPLNGADKEPPLEIIEAGTALTVRTTDDIRADRSDGRVFSAEIDQNVRDARGKVVLSRGADVELLIRSASDREYTLDIESITVNGRRMGVQLFQTSDAGDREKSDAIASGARFADKALVGVILGAMTWGGGRNATLTQDPGAIPRMDVQVATRGKAVKLPADTIVVFRLDKPLRAGVPDVGFSRNGQHFHAGFGTRAGNTAAYDAGLRAGRADKQRKGKFDPQPVKWTSAEAPDYQAGYERGVAETPAAANGANSIQIGADSYIRWNGPPASQVYVRVDNRKRLFSVDESGVQPAPWIRHGHKYVFTLVDQNGKEIARDENDLRSRRVK